MKVTDAEKRLREIFPDAYMDEDNDGQVVIYTNMTTDEDGYELVPFTEPCGTCNYDSCQCDMIYDNYRDSLMERD